MTRAAAVLIAALLFAPHAHAQGDPGQARAHFELGVRLVEQGRWSDAVRELEAARAIRATAPVLYNLGIAYRAIGRVRDGIAAFRAFLELLGPGGSAPRRSEVEGYVAELESRLAHVQLRVTPPGASVTVDDREETATQLELDPGRHRVRVSRPGFRDADEEVRLEPGEQRTVEITLVRARTRLHVEASTAGAIVVVDGRRLGPGPIDTEVEPGEHVVEVSAPGHRPMRREFDLSPGEATRWNAELTPEGGSIVESPWLWIAIGVALVGAGLGIGFGVGSGTEEPYVGDLGLVTGVLRGP
jgi:outer membrane receptor for ferrienterochelin and colicins